MKTFQEIIPENLVDNPFKLIGKDWMLITAGTKQSFNTMTGAWGGLGILWNKNICFCVIRPNRYTYEFMERSDIYTLSFLEEQYRDILTYCGTKSGRDVNKVTETNLTPVFDNDSVYFAEARLVLICRKIYFQDIMPAHFLSPEIDEFYPLKDYHRMYVGEIARCLKK
ncbi:MAG: flavin reductase [Proteobacteria bacterium]|nr:flavin reductase [Pseudomonadota bacterium]